MHKPEDGLYLREDIKMDLHVPLVGSPVKGEMRSASAIMIARMKRKADILDEGRLLALFEDVKLKTAKASDAAKFAGRLSPRASMGGQRRTPGAGGEAFDLNMHRNSQMHYKAYAPAHQHQEDELQPFEMDAGGVEKPGCASELPD